MIVFGRQGRRPGDSRRSRQQRRGSLSGQVGGLVRFACEALESRLAPAVSTWSGAVSSSWSVAGNWDSNTVPAAGDDLVFPAGVTNKTSTNDVASLVIYGNLTIADSGYTIGGNSIGLTGMVTASQTSGGDTVNLPLAFGVATAAVSVDQSGASLVLGGAIAGTAGLSKSGAGLLDLTGANSYTGTTTVSAGVLNVDDAQSGSPVTVSSGATLGGAGTVGTITTNLGIVQPGSGTAPAVLTDAGDLNLGAGSNFNIMINGTGVGSMYSQLGVNGQVNLNGASLTGTGTFTPTGNTPFTIINNTGTGAVHGTFAGLPEGATVTIAGHPYRITYAGGGSGSGSNDVVLTSLQGSNAALSASTTATTFGQSVTLTATITAATSGVTTVPTGTVEFFNGTTSLGTATLNNSGVGTLSTTSLPIGANSITVHYRGDSNFTPSDSTATTVNITQGPTTTTLSTAFTPTVLGQLVNLTATVAGTGAGVSPTGTVQFFDGTTSLGSITLTSAATTGPSTAILRTSSLGLGTHSITATYSGDANYSASTSTAVSQVVSQAGTTTTLATSPNPSTVGQAVTLTASVVSLSTTAGVSPTGTVQFFNGSTSLGTAPVNGSGVATLTTTALPLGTLSITATYSGDANFTASTAAAASQTVRPGGATIALSGLNKANPAFGENVSFTITVAGPAGSATAPTGKVDIFANGIKVGSRDLSQGTATFDINNLEVGPKSITAVYQGDSSFTGGATSAPLSLVVGTKNEQLLNSVYLAVLHRPVDTIGLATWGFLFRAGVSSKKIAREIARSPEAKQVAAQGSGGTGTSTGHAHHSSQHGHGHRGSTASG
jgi:autotransporter-associated beta strand protein